MKSGACPTTETLNAYLSGELGPAQSAGVMAHASQCGLCDNLLERMRAFDEPGEHPLPDSEWRGMERDLTADFERRLAKTHPPERRNILRTWLWRPALGYALALMLAFPAARWFLRERPTAPFPAAVAIAGPPAAVWVPTIELNTTRDRQPTAEPMAGSDQFVLRFIVPSKKSTRFSAEIRDAAGKPVAIVRDLVTSDERGSLSLLCRRQEFAPGQYTLAVTEAGGSGEQSLFSFHL